MFLRSRTGFCRLFTTLLVILPVTSALGDEEKATAAILQELLKRIDSLEVQNKELRNQLERPAAPDPTMGALVEQLRVLQERLDALEKVKPTESAPPTTDLAKPEKPETTSLLEGPKPSGTQGMSKLVEDLLDDRAKAEVRKRAEQEEVGSKAKESEQKKADWFEVGKNMKMSATWNHGLQFTSEDEAFKFHLGGRVDFDNAWYRTDKNLLFGSSDEIGLHDGTDFRRMRLRADGRFWDFVDFVFEVNFANLQDFSNTDQAITVGSVGLTDVNLTFRPLPVVGNIKVGHFLPPISLEHMSSSNYTYYMERSPQFDAFINRFDYANGVSFFNSYRDDRVTFSAALLRTGSRTINPFGAGSGTASTATPFGQRCSLSTRRRVGGSSTLESRS